MLIDNINLKIGKRYHFKNQKLNLELEKINYVTGQNGSGKTILLEYLAGMYGSKINLSPLYILNETLIEENQSVLFNIEMLLDMIEIKMSYSRILDLSKILNCELHLDKMVSEVSSGSKKKITLFPLFAEEISNDVIIVDEPFNYLDAETQKIILARLMHLTNSEKKTIILTNHISDIKIESNIIEISDNGIIKNSK